MKKIGLTFLILLLANGLIAQKKTYKKFTFGALPAVSYDSDLGLQYGALVNLYFYGDSLRFPRYDHSLYFEYSTYTKGSSIARFRYDSERLILSVRTTLDIAYVGDQMSDFYGFNGYQTRYDAALSAQSRNFYKMERNMFRLKADFQGYFGNSRFGWLAGYTFYHFDIDSVDIHKLDLQPIEGGNLYQRFVRWGLVDPSQARGGDIHYLKVGLKYDSRDQLACPMKGIWTEAAVQMAPSVFNSFPHAKFSLIHRQYFTLATDMSLAFRVDYQATIGSHQTPFFAQPLFVTSFLTAAVNQGIGGKNSVRGVLRNRVVGDDVCFGNLEWRYKFIRFEWLKQNFYVGTNVFFDSGIVLKAIELNPQVVEAHPEVFATYKSGKFHSSAGLGLKIGWNENFVISADYGRCFNSQDGKAGTYIALNYLF